MSDESAHASPRPVIHRGNSSGSVGAISTVAVHRAVVAGDLQALRRACHDAPEFPNVRDECGAWVLDAAIHHGALAFVRQLLDLGADVNYHDDTGFPSLFAAIDRAGPEQREVLALLLAHGADVARRGANDYTPLHHAACRDHADAVRLLLDHGADPEARTRIDEYATPLEEAERLGRAAAAAALRDWLSARGRSARTPGPVSR